MFFVFQSGFSLYVTRHPFFCLKRCRFITQRYSQLWIQNRKDHFHSEFKASTKEICGWCKKCFNFLPTQLLNLNIFCIILFNMYVCLCVFPLCTWRMMLWTNSSPSPERDSHFARKGESLEAFPLKRLTDMQKLTIAFVNRPVRCIWSLLKWFADELWIHLLKTLGTVFFFFVSHNYVPTQTFILSTLK